MLLPALRCCPECSRLRCLCREKEGKEHKREGMKQKKWMNERKKGKKKRRDFWRRNSSFSRHVQLKEIDIRYSCRSTRKSNAGLEWMM